MLGKLMKYEFRATGRYFLPSYAIMIALAVVFCIAVPFSGKDIGSGIVVVCALLLVLVTNAMWIMTVVLVIRRFWTNLLGPEGYLMHTLPVGSWQHILAKLLTSVVWCVCGIVVSAVAFIIVMLDMSAVEEDFWADVGDGVKALFSYLRDNAMAGSAVRFGIEIVVFVLLFCAVAVLMIYAAMAVGQLANKHRGWAGIGAFVGLDIIFSEFSARGLALVYNRFPEVRWSGNAAASLVAVNDLLLFAIGVSLVSAAVLFFLTDLIMRRSLNLR